MQIFELALPPFQNIAGHIRTKSACSRDQDNQFAVLP